MLRLHIPVEPGDAALQLLADVREGRRPFGVHAPMVVFKSMSSWPARKDLKTDEPQSVPKIGDGTLQSRNAEKWTVKMALGVGSEAAGWVLVQWDTDLPEPDRTWLVRRDKLREPQAPKVVAPSTGVHDWGAVLTGGRVRHISRAAAAPSMLQESRGPKASGGRKHSADIDIRSRHDADSPAAGCIAVTAKNNDTLSNIARKHARQHKVDGQQYLELALGHNKKRAGFEGLTPYSKLGAQTVVHLPLTASCARCKARSSASMTLALESALRSKAMDGTQDEHLFEGDRVLGVNNGRIVACSSRANDNRSTIKAMADIGTNAERSPPKERPRNREEGKRECQPKRETKPDDTLSVAAPAVGMSSSSTFVQPSAMASNQRMRSQRTVASCNARRDRLPMNRLTRVRCQQQVVPSEWTAQLSLLLVSDVADYELYCSERDHKTVLTQLSLGRPSTCSVCQSKRQNNTKLHRWFCDAVECKYSLCSACYAKELEATGHCAGLTGRMLDMTDACVTKLGREQVVAEVSNYQLVVTNTVLRRIVRALLAGQIAPPIDNLRSALTSLALGLSPAAKVAINEIMDAKQIEEETERELLRITGLPRAMATRQLALPVIGDTGVVYTMQILKIGQFLVLCRVKELRSLQRRDAVTDAAVFVEDVLTERTKANEWLEKIFSRKMKHYAGSEKVEDHFCGAAVLTAWFPREPTPNVLEWMQTTDQLCAGTALVDLDKFPGMQDPSSGMRRACLWYLIRTASTECAFTAVCCLLSV